LGGAAGFSAIIACLDENIEPVCFEMSDNFGDVWNYTGAPLEERVTVYKSTISNTSKEITAFSDYPMPIKYPNYIDHKMFLDYYRSYSHDFKLMERI
jgi:dimethylaniline monooxygenase (N-oxide forming)